MLTSTSTTSKTFVTMPGTSVTPGAGTFLVLLSAQLRSADGTNDGGCSGGSGHEHDHMAVALYLDGDMITGTERIVDAKKFHYQAVATQAVVTLTAGQTLSARWRTLDSKQKELRERSLIVLEVQ